MIAPDIPADEPVRIATLERLCVLDTPPEERFDRYTRLAARLFDIPIALVSLVDERRQWFKSRYGLDAVQTPRDVSFCGHVVAHQRLMVIENALLDERFNDNPLVTDGPQIRFYAGAPLEAPNGQMLGTLCVIDTEPRSFSPSDRQALADLAIMVSSELSALEVAGIDELTALNNRRGLWAFARHALAGCVRFGKKASLVMIDLDGFKEVNDRYGHMEGDQVLKDFADLLRETMREIDVVARIGGDEFCALLPGADAAGSWLVVERLRCALRERLVGRPYSVEFSAGVIEHAPERHQRFADLMDEADKLMYERKRRKKDVA